MDTRNAKWPEASGIVPQRMGLRVRYDVVILASIALLATGCTARKSPEPEGSLGSAQVANVGISEPPVAQGDGERELWYLDSVLGERVGYERIVIRQKASDGVPYREVEGETRLSVNRQGTPVEVIVRYRSRETPDGRPRDFTMELIQGKTLTRSVGRVVGQQLIMETEVSGRTARHVVSIPSDCRGFLGVQDSLWANPLRVGEERQLHTLFVGIHGVCLVHLKAEGDDTLELPGGRSRLVRVAVTFELPEGQKLRGRLWIDKQGLIQKQEIESPPMTSVLASRDEVLKADAGVGLDLVRDVRIPARAPKNLATAVRAVYLLSAPAADLSEVLVEDGNQKVLRRGDGTWELIVAPRRLQTPAINCGDQATAADLAPSLWIQSDAPEIQTLAQSLTAGNDSPGAAALSLERYAFETIKNRGYNQTFLSALDVLHIREGDCTEHAVLLAALARARNIPARVAVGLIHHQDAFYYHMWTEVLIDGCWIGLDATRGNGGITPEYIKLGQSSLAGPNAMEAFLPVMRVLGQVKIEILRLDP